VHQVWRRRKLPNARRPEAVFTEPLFPHAPPVRALWFQLGRESPLSADDGEDGSFTVLVFARFVGESITRSIGHDSKEHGIGGDRGSGTNRDCCASNDGRPPTRDLSGDPGNQRTGCLI
jgi:hypothetical protein